MLRTLVLFSAIAFCFPAWSQDTWPRFRGENGSGLSSLKGLPTQWTEEDYEWKIDLPGVGHSSPVIWKDVLFLATGEATGERALRCYDAITGKPRWTETTTLGTNNLHKKTAMPLRHRLSTRNGCTSHSGMTSTT